MTEFFVEEQKHLNAVTKELRDVAVLVEPLTVAEKAIAQVWQVQSRLPWVNGSRNAVMAKRPWFLALDPLEFWERWRYGKRFQNVRLLPFRQTKSESSARRFDRGHLHLFRDRPGGRIRKAGRKH